MSEAEATIDSERSSLHSGGHFGGDGSCGQDPASEGSEVGRSSQDQDG